MKSNCGLLVVIPMLFLSSAVAWAGPTSYPIGSAQEEAQIKVWQAEMNEKVSVIESDQDQGLEDLLLRIEAGEFDLESKQVFAITPNEIKASQSK